jgi:hypothetical protein
MPDQVKPGTNELAGAEDGGPNWLGLTFLVQSTAVMAELGTPVRIKIKSIGKSSSMDKVYLAGVCRRFTAQAPND